MWSGVITSEEIRPHLPAGLSIDEDALVETVNRTLLKRRARWVVPLAVGSFVGVVAAVAAGGWLVARMLGRFEYTYAVLAVVATVGLRPLWGLVARRMARSTVWEVLRNAGVAVCDRCGYDLRGCGRARKCPECGTGVALMARRRRGRGNRPRSVSP